MPKKAFLPEPEDNLKSIQDNLIYRIEFFKNYFNESLQNKMSEIINYKEIGK